MRRTRLFTIAAAGFAALTFSAAAHEDCGCRERLVLNGRLNTADFDGGVGDRFGDGGGGYVITYGGASSSAVAGSRAFAFARASAFAHAQSGTHGGRGMHGGGYGHH